MSKDIAKIRVGHANSITVRLKAKNVDTGEIVTLTSAQMATITRAVLVLDSTNSIDSNVSGIGLGASGKFDNVTLAATGDLIMTLGAVTGLSALVGGDYSEPHLDIYFNTVASGLPIEFEHCEVQIVA